MPDTKTPGIYIEEMSALPPSVVAVATAVPVFIGYTEFAKHGDTTLENRPFRIASLLEYEQHFGKGFQPVFRIETADAGAESIVLNGKSYRLNYPTSQQFYLYNSLRLFYANGGSTCYIYCVDTYGSKPQGIERSATDFTNALEVLKKEHQITLIIMPDAVTFEEAYTSIYTAVLQHCNEVQSCFAILDLFRQKPGDTIDKQVKDFRSKIGTANLNYGAAYYPWLNTVVVQPAEVDLENIDFADTNDLSIYLPEPGVKELMSPQNKLYKAMLPALKMQRKSTKAKYTNQQKVKSIQAKSAFHQSLKQLSPTYNKIIDAITFSMNQLPSGGAVAGIYSLVDNTSGVWKAPASIALNMVNSPALTIDDLQQQLLNIDIVEGKSINAVRAFTGKGTLVWGARTLAGNSHEWRYINVRRTITMIQQSVKLAMTAYVFEPNDANTWVKVKNMVGIFLVNLWKQGALQGVKAEQACFVHVGLGITMTAGDIRNNLMIVEVGLAMLRPAEFTIIRLQQKMQQP